MKQLITRIIKSLWTFKQPITNQPKNNIASISDLFVWFRNNEFEVFFELLNIDYLSGNDDPSEVEIVFFDKAGNIFFTQRIELLNGYRQCLNITELLDRSCNIFISGDHGTFAIFHLNTPYIIREMNSFIAERGYISYRYKQSPISSYVHGNFDAIGKIGGEYMALGGDSLFKRNYNLQYQFVPGKKYKIVLTNPCKKTKKISIKKISLISGKKIRGIEFEINSRAIFFYDMEDEKEPFRISIESRMVMARPIIFSFKEENMDVFHG